VFALGSPAQATHSGTNGPIFLTSGANIFKANFGSMVSPTQVSPAGGLIAATPFGRMSVNAAGSQVAYAKASGIFTTSTAPSGTEFGPLPGTAGCVEPSYAGANLVILCAPGAAAAALNTVPANGSATPTPLVVSGLPAGTVPYHPEASPDSLNVAFQAAAAGAADLSASQLFTVAIGGGTAQPRSTAGSVALDQVSWRPDNARIAVTTPAGGCGAAATTIATLSASALLGAPACLANSASGDTDSSYSPDASVLFLTNGGGATAFSIATSGAPGTRIPNGPTAFVVTVSSHWAVGAAAGTATPAPTATPGPTATAAPTATATPPNAAPTFASSSNCGGTLAAPAFGAPVTQNVSASDPNSGDVVTLSAAIPTPIAIPIPFFPVPAPITFVPGAPGNPTSGVLTATGGILQWLFGGLGASSTNVAITARDNRTPALSATCTIGVRYTLLNATI
jgi:hypothetical protein